uniref:Ig-like domain-containing protein n=1 Tax=Pygocentrus nattereri TaxID=42514 RepID=A0A3B4C770_PYGNA
MYSPVLCIGLPAWFSSHSAVLISVECQHAVGVIGRTTKISCSIKTTFGSDQKIIISAASATKRGETDPVFWFQNDVVKGDHRFKLASKNDPSLLLTDTAVSDEGQYDYTAVTNRGIIKDATFRITKYNPPSISTWPVKIVEGGPADFYCNSSGGYPAGAIHWFDSTNTNWTMSATLEVTEREDQLLEMSSKLTFTSIDSSWEPIRCVVLNSKFVKEGESTIHLMRIDECPCCSSQTSCAIQFCTEDGEYEISASKRQGRKPTLNARDLRPLRRHCIKN